MHELRTGSARFGGRAAPVQHTGVARQTPPTYAPAALPITAGTVPLARVERSTASPRASSHHRSAHRIVTLCERLRIPALADKAYEGAGGTFRTPLERHRGHELTAHQNSVNRAYAPPEQPGRACLGPVEGRADRRHARRGLNRLKSMVKASSPWSTTAEDAL